MCSDFRIVTTGLLCTGLAAGAASPGFAEPNPLRDAYYGETHLHTSWSFDAFVIGNTHTTPADAYKYAKRQPIKHPLGYRIVLTQDDLRQITVAWLAQGRPPPARDSCSGQAAQADCCHRALRAAGRTRRDRVTCGVLVPRALSGFLT